jgi:amidohydrolase
MNYLREITGLEIVDRGVWFYAVYRAEGGEPIAFRADMDAVSGKEGNAGHYCGHDGHSAVLAGFGKILEQVKPDRDVYLIFQPAEETGQGAVLCAPLLKECGIKEIYGFHNIPGYERGSILVRKGTFACASTGLEIRVMGKPSHAAYPEDGKNPAFLLSRIVTELPEMLSQPHRGILLATVIGMEIGGDAYGVSASEGVLRLTVRGEYEEEFRRLLAGICDKVQSDTNQAGMKCTIREIERFPATENHIECTKKIVSAAGKTGRRVLELEEPMRWSEDFGYYLREIPGAFFGVGDGEEYPQLHTESFEFPDEIIPIIWNVYQELLK